MRYRQKLHYFDYKFDNEELIEQFETFIDNNMKEFFTEAESLGVKITVPWNLARSTINEGGNFNKVFKSLANTFAMQSSNNSRYKDRHQQFIFVVILDETRHMGLQALVNKINKYLQELSADSFTWNKVYYGNYLERTYNVRW